MNKVNITLTFIKNLINELSIKDVNFQKSPKNYSFNIEQGNQKIFRDSELSGFGIRVTQNAIVYIAEKKMSNGSPCRVTIGKHGLYTPDLARKEAKEHLFNMSKGINPNHEKQKNRSNSKQHSQSQKLIPTLAIAYEAYKQAKSNLKPSTLLTYDRSFRLYLTNWHHLLITDVTKKMIIETHTKISKTNKSHANIAMKLFSAIYNHHRKLILDSDDQPAIKNHSPVEILYKNNLFNKLKPRKGYINSEQRQDWALAIVQTQWKGQQNNNAFAYLNQDFLFTFILTGLRRNEVEKLQWSNIDLKYGTLAIINPKNGNDLKLTLGNTLWHILKERSKRSVGNQYVFPSTDCISHVKDRRHVRHRITKTTGIKFTFHDLRRTFASIANSCGIGFYTVKSLLNHTHRDNSDITADYTLIEEKDLRIAMNRIEDQILSEEVKSLILSRTYQ